MRKLMPHTSRRCGRACMVAPALLFLALPACAAPKSKRAQTPAPSAIVKPSGAPAARALDAHAPSPVTSETGAPIGAFTPADTSVPPPSLPRAPRERMRACAEEWDQKKLASKSGLPMWRDFATGCLTRAEAQRAGAPTQKGAPQKISPEE